MHSNLLQTYARKIFHHFWVVSTVHCKQVDDLFRLLFCEFTLLLFCGFSSWLFGFGTFFFHIVSLGFAAFLACCSFAVAVWIVIRIVGLSRLFRFLGPPIFSITVMLKFGIIVIIAGSFSRFCCAFKLYIIFIRVYFLLLFLGFRSRWLLIFLLFGFAFTFLLFTFALVLTAFLFLLLFLFALWSFGVLQLLIVFILYLNFLVLWNFFLFFHLSPFSRFVISKDLLTKFLLLLFGWFGDLSVWACPHRSPRSFWHLIEVMRFLFDPVFLVDDLLTLENTLFLSLNRATWLPSSSFLLTLLIIIVIFAFFASRLFLLLT